MDSLSVPNYYIKIGRLHGHRYGKKPGDREYYIANSLTKRCKKRNYLGIHDRFIRDATFRKNMYDAGRDEEMCREMNKLADEDHTHHLNSDEFRVFIDTIGGSVRTQLDPTRCPQGIELTSNKQCLPCDSSKTKRIQLIGKDGKILPRAGKDHGGLLILTKVNKKPYPVLIDQGNLINK